MKIQILEIARKQDQMELKQDEMKVVKFIGLFLSQFIFYYFLSQFVTISSLMLKPVF